MLHLVDTVDLKNSCLKDQENGENEAGIKISNGEASDGEAWICSDEGHKWVQNTTPSQVAIAAV